LNFNFKWGSTFYDLNLIVGIIVQTKSTFLKITNTIKCNTFYNLNDNHNQTGMLKNHRSISALVNNPIINNIFT
jgi:hypothetical protein